MKTVEFKFDLDDKVTVTKTGFTGIITSCAISGDPDMSEKTYFVDGAENSGWYAERLLKEAD